jgi:hypothetical protein
MSYPFRRQAFAAKPPDGIKRTGADCCETLVEVNGAMLQTHDPDLYVQYIALAEGQLNLRARVGGRNRLLTN